MDPVHCCVLCEIQGANIPAQVTTQLIKEEVGELVDLSSAPLLEICSTLEPEQREMIRNAAWKALEVNGEHAARVIHPRYYQAQVLGVDGHNERGIPTGTTVELVLNNTQPDIMKTYVERLIRESLEDKGAQSPQPGLEGVPRFGVVTINLKKSYIKHEDGSGWVRKHTYQPASESLVDIRDVIREALRNIECVSMVVVVGAENIGEYCLDVRDWKEWFGGFLVGSHDMWFVFLVDVVEIISQTPKGPNQPQETEIIRLINRSMIGDESVMIGQVVRLGGKASYVKLRNLSDCICENEGNQVALENTADEKETNSAKPATPQRRRSGYIPIADEYKHMTSGEKRTKIEELIKQAKMTRPFKRAPGKRRNNAAWECQICDRTFNRKLDLKKHIESHIKPRDLPCTKCDMVFKNLSELRVHSKTHIPRNERQRFQCPTCKVTYFSKFDAQRHMKRTSNKCKQMSPRKILPFENSDSE